MSLLDTFMHHSLSHILMEMFEWIAVNIAYLGTAKY